MSLNTAHLEYSRLMRSILFLFVTLISFPVFAKEIYKVTLKRIDQDLYQDNYSKVIIQTRYCYEYVYFDDALLIDDGFSSKIIFSGGTNCDVKRIIK